MKMVWRRWRGGSGANGGVMFSSGFAVGGVEIVGSYLFIYLFIYVT
jgi:hypothetical protein